MPTSLSIFASSTAFSFVLPSLNPISMWQSSPMCAVTPGEIMFEKAYIQPSAIWPLSPMASFMSSDTHTPFKRGSTTVSLPIIGTH